ncbi:hypothetical protein MLD38_003503 [Melastoma candidum]|uniref:Uncharacterized protein n=1 Tax=Melastoma candidum TaxID=119954 RepID=A0ACB9S4S0_9MYRT|nr:hypothetical protein MLD38_003503 [Melastoma candidum]
MLYCLGTKHVASDVKTRLRRTIISVPQDRLADLNELYCKTICRWIPCWLIHGASRELKGHHSAGTPGTNQRILNKNMEGIEVCFECDEMDGITCMRQALYMLIQNASFCCSVIDPKSTV